MAKIVVLKDGISGDFSHILIKQTMPTDIWETETKTRVCYTRQSHAKKKREWA